MREIREQARSESIRAARSKAVAYCDAAEVELGLLLHIEDVNPDQLAAQREGIHLGGVHGHAPNLAAPDIISEGDGCSPSAISVAGAVRLAFSIANQNG